jgi:PAS domain S-box-containing protein
MAAGSGCSPSEAELLDAVQLAVVATDLQGRIVFWNRFAEQSYGWSADEALGQAYIDLMPSMAPVVRAGASEALRRGEAWRGQVEVRRKDASRFMALVIDSPLLVEGRLVGVVQVSAPASDTVAAEKAVVRSERQLRQLFNSIDEGYCLCEMVVDQAGAPVDYRFLEINPLFEQMTGLVDPVGKAALELVPDLESVWVQTYARVGLGREVVRFEQGSAVMGRWFDVSAVPVEPDGHFAIVFKDQTARRQAELALAERHEFISEVTALVLQSHLV